MRSYIDFDVRSCFFIEDTSVRIEALSNAKDFPGLQVKEWFARMSFAQLNAELNERDGGRTAIVKSGIALHIPGLREPILLHSETSGVVALTEPRFAANFQYPWLTPATFNGWFIPDGQVGEPKRLGEMEFEESRPYDFRGKNIEGLIDRYIQLCAAANLLGSSFVMRRPNTLADGQLSLLRPRERLVIAVIGHKCAGKTTFGDIAAIRDDVQVFEASSFFRSIADDHDLGGATDVAALDFLHRQVGMDAVAREAIEYMTGFRQAVRIITGLRTVEELTYLKGAFGRVSIVLVEADQRLRYERLIARGRGELVKSYRDFQRNDEHQNRFGALRVARDIADVIIQNDSAVGSYAERVLGSIERAFDDRADKTRHTEASELTRSLAALSALNGEGSCEEIAAKSEELGKGVRVYNANRALKRVPEFVERLESNGDDKLRYRMLAPGHELLSLLA